jgi:acyl-CoA synthetase (AMP-forming)/AMP-acid ligase II
VVCRPVSSSWSQRVPADYGVQQRFLDTFGLKIHSFYGTSETGGITLDDTATLAMDRRSPWPPPGITVTLRRVEGADEDAGLRVHGPVMPLRVATHRSNPAMVEASTSRATPPATWHVRPSGALIRTGRVSSFVNVAGRKVQPEEVVCLRMMPQLADARVVGVPDVAPRRAACSSRRALRHAALCDGYCVCMPRRAARTYKVPRSFRRACHSARRARQTDRRGANSVTACLDAAAGAGAPIPVLYFSANPIQRPAHQTEDRG